MKAKWKEEICQVKFTGELSHLRDWEWELEPQVDCILNHSQRVCSFGSLQRKSYEQLAEDMSMLLLIMILLTQGLCLDLKENCFWMTLSRNVDPCVSFTSYLLPPLTMSTVNLKWRTNSYFKPDSLLLLASGNLIQTPHTCTSLLSLVTPASIMVSLLLTADEMKAPVFYVFTLIYLFSIAVCRHESGVVPFSPLLTYFFVFHLFIFSCDIYFV